MASRTTSSKSCVTRISGMSSVRRSSSISSCRRRRTRAIDGRKRLVEQQHRRLARQRSRERDPLTLAARQLVRPPVDRVRTGAPASAARSARARRSRARAMAERGHHVARRGQMRKERVLLEDEPDRAAMRRRERPARRCRVQVSPPDRDRRVRRADRARRSLRRMVVLPLPDGPKMASTSPASHVNSTSSGIGPG